MSESNLVNASANVAVHDVVSLYNYANLMYLRSFPPGYRFAPSDEELIHHYLARKLKNERLPPNSIVDENIYKYHPRDLTARYREYGEKEWYFFTPRDRKYPNGSRPSRTTAEGHWKATGSDKPIIGNEEIIGFRRALVYYIEKKNNKKNVQTREEKEKKKKKAHVKTNWIMHEYRVNEDENAKKAKKKNKDMRLDKWVLCKIYEKNEKNEKVVEAAAASSPIAAENIQDGESDDNVAEAYTDNDQPQLQSMAEEQHYEDVELKFLSEPADGVDHNSFMYFGGDYDNDLGFNSLVFETPCLYNSPQIEHMQCNVMDQQQQQRHYQNYYYCCCYNSFQNPSPLDVLPPADTYSAPPPGTAETNYYLDVVRHAKWNEDIHRASN